MTLVIQGFSSDDKRPGSFRETKFGQGRVSIGSIPVRVVCTGLLASDATITADQDVVQVFSEDDAITKGGARGEITLQAIAALQVPGVEVWMAPVANPGTPTAASLTILVGGTASYGTLRFRIGAQPFSVGVATGDSVNDIASAISDAANSVANSPCDATVSTATATLTAASTGARGNQILFYWDSSECPNLTLTVTGGTAIHAGHLAPLHNGAGADSVANVLALLADDTYDYLAVAQNDVTNAALVKAHLASQAMAGTSHLEHALYCSGDAYATALTLAATTLNDQRSAVGWLENSETPPASVAATLAALRGSIAQQMPNYKWAGQTVPGVLGQYFKGDIPGAATQKAALNNGLTPLITQNNGSSVTLLRGIVSHCLDGTSPDYRTLDWADVDVPDRVNKEVGALWDEVAAANPYAQPDPADGDPAAAEQVLTPSRWNAKVTKLLQDKQDDRWIYDVANNLPTSEWDSERKCIMSAIPTVVLPKSFQLGASVRQIAS